MARKPEKQSNSMKGKKSQKSFDVDAWFNARMKELAGSDFELPVIDDFELPKIDDFEFPWLIDIPDEVALAAIGVRGRGDADKSRASSQKNAPARVMGCAGGGARELKPRCGAKTRTGKPCQAPGNGRGGRCKLHGGKSTGPKTQEGQARSLAALQGNHSR